MRIWLLTLPVFLIVAGTAWADCVPDSKTTTFNASNDLHKVGGHDMKPNDPSHDAAPRLAEAIAYVTNHPDCKELVVDPGTYYFYRTVSTTTQPVKSTYVLIQNVNDLKIDFRGSALKFKESFYSAFYIDNCNDCAFANFSIDYEHLPFTQLDVQSVTDAEIFVTPQPGWPNQDQVYTHQTRVGGKDSVFLRGFNTRGGIPQYGYTAWPLPPPDGKTPAHRIPLNSYSVIQPGDVFIVAARGGGPAIYQQNSKSTTFKDITIYTSGGPAIESWSSEAMSFIDIRVEPNTGDPNGKRLVSTVAGGIQLNNMRGPSHLVRDCVVMATQDDSIAGHVTAANIAAVVSSDLAVIPGRPPANPVFFMNGTTGATVGAPPSSQGYRLALQNPPITYSIKPSLTQGQANTLGNNAYVYGQSTFGRAMSVTVQNNRIHNSYLARGIAFSGVSGISITDNVLNGTQQGGIVLGTDLPTYAPVDNSLIANNQLFNTNMGMSGVGQSMLGAIEVMAYATSGDVMGEQLNHHVFVKNNFVSTTQRSAVWIGNVHGGTVEANQVIDSGLALGNLGIDSHLNDGLKSYAAEAFSKPLLAWCVTDVSGPLFNMCYPPAGLAK